MSDGSILKVDDFLQNYALTVCVNQYVAKADDVASYKISAEDLQPPKEQSNGN